MAILDILLYPDERLRTVATPVETVDDQMRRFLDDMFETMYQAPGIGLAATQVDVHQRLVVIDVSEDKQDPLVLINPEILTAEGKMDGEEGCLSIPGIYDSVSRAEKITFRALDRNGDVYEREADGLLAVCVQHEVDHLDGKMFVDYLSAMKRRRINKKIQKNTLRVSD